MFWVSFGMNLIVLKPMRGGNNMSTNGFVVWLAFVAMGLGNLTMGSIIQRGVDQKAACEAGAAKWVVDAKTGETFFVWCGNIQEGK